MTPEMDDRGNSELMELQIVDNLKRAYNQTLTEAVPDRFFDLLRKLREAEAGEVKPDNEPVDDLPGGNGPEGSGPGGSGLSGSGAVP